LEGKFFDTFLEYLFIIGFMLIPTKETIRKIFETHKNQCAFSECNKEILDSDGHLNGNILFLESNRKDRPRFNPELSNEEMIDYHNLILVCWEHAFNVEYKEKKYTVSKLRDEIFRDLQSLNPEQYNLPNEVMQEILFQFIEHHDPDTLSHVEVKGYASALSLGSPRFSVQVDDVHIDPTKQFAGGKFEIIDVSKKLNAYDTVVFYPKNSKSSEGVQADSETKSSMRIVGQVPNIPAGDYLVSIRSAIDDSPRIQEDLAFTVL
jgi:hypothetical protein